MDRWIPGVIVTRLGDLHYDIKYQGRRFKRHVDQIRSRFEHRGTKGQPGTTQQTDASAGVIERPRYIRY